MSRPDQAPPASSARIEWFYRLSLLAKGSLGLAQLLGALGLILAPGGAAQRWVDMLTRNEIADDPDDPLARFLVDWANSLTTQSEHFYSIYLLGHGVLNLGVVLALLLRIRGAYHVSLAVLIGFVCYQLFLFTRAPDVMLLVLTAIDMAVIALVLLERRTHPREARP
ncbi:MAG: DUF2127 domain-containing protein [Rhodobacter sp.]|nr:DUF2127 domain-containing protein [Rhodobacter sp.]